MTRSQMVAVAAIRAAAIAAIGAILAVAFAIFASPRMPIGLARQAEIHRGISIDGAVLAIGAITIVALLTAYTAIVAWRAVSNAGASNRRRVSGRPSRIAATLRGMGSPPSVALGTTLAFESGRGSGGIPARTALASAALAMTVVTGALTFGANLTASPTNPSCRAGTGMSRSATRTPTTSRTPRSRCSSVIPPSPRSPRSGAAKAYPRPSKATTRVCSASPW